MRRLFAVFAAVASILLSSFALAGKDAGRPLVNTIRMDGAIDPATALYVHRTIQISEENHAQALIVLMDTPGGLLDSTKSIVKDFYDSRVPIVVYIYPQTARGASAGSIISLASHIAAMSPSTHIGAAHPVSATGGQPDKVMGTKIENDTVAFVKGIAEKRHRPISWADQVVRKSISLTENEAMKKGIIDIIATDQSDLLKKLNGRKTETAAGKVTLVTANARVESIEPTIRERFLHAIDNPNILYLFMLLAMYGIIFELSNPGAILPGVVGGIALIVVLYSLAIVPVNMAGIMLILFAVALFLIDLHVPTHGILTTGGVISFAVGSLILFEGGSEAFRISSTLVITMALLTGAFFMFAVGSGIRAQKNRVVTGREGMIGQVVEAKTDLDPTGKVFAEGSWWNAETEDEPIKQGDKVRITGMRKLTLIVRKEE